MSEALALHAREGESLAPLADLARLANESHRKAEGAAVSALEYARDAGEHLARAKAQCQHGEWLPWLEVNFEASRVTAANYMRLAANWDSPNVQRVLHLGGGLRAALAELAEPRVVGLLPIGNTPLPSNEGQARALGRFAPDVQADIMTNAQRLSDELGKPVTAGFIERVGAVFEEAKLTGHVDTGDGTSTPLEAALTVEAFEHMQRQKERIRSHYEEHEANGHRKPDAPKPHVAHNSGDNEWYTPPAYLDAARKVMGGIDLDPASSAIANERVQAAIYFTAEDNGLTRAWGGRVWMNPPYASELIGQFCEKLAQHFEDGTVTEAIVLVNNATETRWFQRLANLSSCVAFPSGRVRFLDPQGNPGAPLQGQAVIYLGANAAHFAAVFSEFGFIR